MFFSQPYKVVTTKERKIFLDMDNRYNFLNFTKASLSKFVGYDYVWHLSGQDVDFCNILPWIVASVPSTNKNARHEKTEILLKEALTTITLTLTHHTPLIILAYNGWAPLLKSPLHWPQPHGTPPHHGTKLLLYKEFCNFMAC